MKMKMTRFFTVLLILVMLATNSISAFASNSITQDDWVLNSDLATNEVYIQNVKTGEKIYHAFKFDASGNLVPKDLTEYVIELNNYEIVPEPLSTNGIITPLSPTTYDLPRFVRTGTSKVNGSPVKVTADVLGPASLAYGNSSTITNSFSVAPGITGEITSKIKLSANFTWVNSASTNTVFGVTFPVSANKKGYVQFTPYLNKVSGDSYMDTYNTANILVKSVYCGISHGYSPILLSNGFADGIFALVEK